MHEAGDHLTLAFRTLGERNMTEAVRRPSLTRLAVDLRKALNAGLVNQVGIATALGIPTSTISKAKHGKLRQETADTRALRAYVAELLDRREVPVAVSEATLGYLAAGGSDADLVDLICLATKMIRQR